MKIVFLDALTLGTDIDLSPAYALGEVVTYANTTSAEVAERIADADVVVLSKVEVNESTIGEAKNLKLICVTATGINNLDLDFLKRRQIEWRNVVGYSTDCVAQHTFALLFYLLEKLKYYDEYVKNGDYINCPVFTHLDEGFKELSQMTWGIIGLGAIGRKVADIATAFGAKVIYHSPSGQAPQDGYTQVDFDTLLETSDIVSIHAPLNEYTENLMDTKVFSKMKTTAILINVGRGPIVVEADLKDALTNGTIAAAGLDVLCKEPMTADNPLFEIKDSKRLLITPHIAWAAYETRMRVLQMTIDSIKDFFTDI